LETVSGCWGLVVTENKTNVPDYFEEDHQQEPASLKYTPTS
jgi:hypothetical protein